MIVVPSALLYAVPSMIVFAPLVPVIVVKEVVGETTHQSPAGSVSFAGTVGTKRISLAPTILLALIIN